MKNKFYITTPIYYPSARLHIGHAYCTTLCDVWARYKRMRGYESFFLTGTDEHGEKIQKNAIAAGKEPQQFVDDIVIGIKHLWEALDISNDDFIRTTEKRHEDVVKAIFTHMVNHGDIYLGQYQGWYCTQCEAFWTDTQVGEKHLCPDCGRDVHTASEEAYFFKTSKYVDRLVKYYEDNLKFITPESRKNEMINTFIKPGLEDLCVSRTSFSWGIPLNEDPKHVVYVWLDALTNYITALGYRSGDETLFNKFWADPNSEVVHVVGADITRFHAIYWPMFLMALGLRLPDRLFVHGLLMMKDGKMSKSKGNVIDPFPLIEKYGTDAVRYYLVRETIFGNDGQFTPEQFVDRINVDLANDFGNLLNRTLTMIEKYFEGVIPVYVGSVTPFDDELVALAMTTIAGYEADMDDLKITEAFMKVLTLVGRANKYIDETQPWALAKDEAKKRELQSVMTHLSSVIYIAATLLQPVLTKAPGNVYTQLGIDPELNHYSFITNFGIIGGSHIKKGAPLFPRLDATHEVPFIASMMKK